MKKSKPPLEFTIPIITALMALTGSVLGALLVAKLEQSNWKERFQIEHQKTILIKRTELIERTSLLLSNSSLMEALETNIQGHIEIIKINQKCLDSIKVEPCQTEIDHNLPERLGRERFSINSDLSSTLTLVSVYFGPKTREALKAIISDPWKSNHQDRQALISAMAGELNSPPSPPMNLLD